MPIQNATNRYPQIRQTFSNAAATISSGTTQLAQTGTMSAARAVTVPLANSVRAGFVVEIIDESGSITSTNKITLARSGSDTINGSTSSVDAVTTAYGSARLISDGTSKWSVFFYNKPSSTSSEVWTRPTDWLTLPTLASTDQRFVGLYAVFAETGFTNVVEVLCQGAFTIDWGDGVTENFTSNTTATHTYTYSSISGSTISSLGYKQVIISITPQSGQNLTLINLQRNTTALNLLPQWLDIAINAPNLTSLTIRGSIRLNKLTHFWLNRNALTSMSSLLNGLQALKYVTLLNCESATNLTSCFEDCNTLLGIGTITNSGSVTNLTNLFNNCRALKSVPLFTTSAVTSFNLTFGRCHSLRTVPLLNMSAGTNFSFLFLECLTLETVPLLNMSAGTNFSFTFSGCSSLQYLPALVLPSGSNLSSIFASCPSLCFSESVFRNTFSIASCAFQRSALVALFNNLATVTGQTITITSNPGAASLSAGERAIATGKGWTIVG